MAQSAIDKISLGPKLDALTAEKVFGWKNVHQHDWGRVLKLPVLILNVESRTVTHSVSSRNLFAPNIDFFRMKVKPLCLHKTEGANNKIE